MPESLQHHSLRESSIVRPINDNGTLFIGDSQFVQTAQLSNFSQDDKGICRVSLARQAFSSHAGTHADSPAHFESDTALPVLPEDSYSGSSLLLDVSHSLRNDLQISRSMIEDVIAQCDVGKAELIRRFLIRSNKESTYSHIPRALFPHLTKEAASFFGNRGARMVAIDTPSVDHPKEQCLSGAVHGLLYEARTAIVENVDLGRVSTGKGEVVTIFDPVRTFADARGISQMYFFPDNQDGTR